MRLGAIDTCTKLQKFVDPEIIYKAEHFNKLGLKKKFFFFFLLYYKINCNGVFTKIITKFT
jgi:hypothetical protein